MSDFKAPVELPDYFKMEILIDSNNNQLGLGLSFSSKEDPDPNDKEDCFVVPLSLRQASELALALIKAVAQLSRTEKSLVEALPKGLPN